MFKKILIVLLVLGFIGFMIDSDEPKESASSVKPMKNNVKSSDRDKVKELKKKDCAEFIKCLSAKEVAREYGKTEQWIVANHRIVVWGKTSAQGKFPKVGEMYAGSRALIIDRSGDDYKIMSPLDKSIGWVNEVQVATTIYQHPKTFEDCK